MFVRLTVSEFHETSGQQLGIFHAVRYLRDDGALTEAEEAAANEVFDWIFDNLESPDNGLLANHAAAVSWFRDNAVQHLQYAQRLVPILEAHGYRVIRTECVDPGEILYSDATQVFARRSQVDR
jgi:hypothetical protein